MWGDGYMDDPFFITSRISSMNIDNPQIYRLNTFCHIIESESIMLPKENKEDLNNIIFNCLKVFSKMEKLLLRYTKIINDTINDLKECKYKITHNSIEWNDPTYELHDCFSEFLIQAAIALRYKTRFAMKAFEDNSLKDHIKRNKRVREKLDNEKEKIGELAYNCSIDMLESDVEWLTELLCW
jgi:hypothetical protein